MGDKFDHRTFETLLFSLFLIDLSFLCLVLLIVTISFKLSQISWDFEKNSEYKQVRAHFVTKNGLPEQFNLKQLLVSYSEEMSEILMEINTHTWFSILFLVIGLGLTVEMKFSPRDVFSLRTVVLLGWGSLLSTVVIFFYCKETKRLLLQQMLQTPAAPSEKKKKKKSTQKKGEKSVNFHQELVLNITQFLLLFQTVYLIIITLLIHRESPSLLLSLLGLLPFAISSFVCTPQILTMIPFAILDSADWIDYNKKNN